MTEAENLARLSAVPVEIHDDAGWSLSLCFGKGDKARDQMRAFSDAYRSGRLVLLPSVEELEKSVMVCPQCDGEGGYPDGLDEAACRTECTRCGGNGWIADATAIHNHLKGTDDE